MQKNTTKKKTLEQVNKQLDSMTDKQIRDLAREKNREYLRLYWARKALMEGAEAGKEGAAQ